MGSSTISNVSHVGTIDSIIFTPICLGFLGYFHQFVDFTMQNVIIALGSIHLFMVAGIFISLAFKVRS